MITKVLYLCEILHIFSEALDFIECLLRVSQCSKHFTSVTLIITALWTSYSQGNWGSERLSNWSKTIVLGGPESIELQFKLRRSALAPPIFTFASWEWTQEQGLSLATGNYLWRWAERIEGGAGWWLQCWRDAFPEGLPRPVTVASNKSEVCLRVLQDIGDHTFWNHGGHVNSFYCPFFRSSWNLSWVSPVCAPTARHTCGSYRRVNSSDSAVQCD